MKFGAFLETNRRADWADGYIDYKSLKKRLAHVRAGLEAGGLPGAAYQQWRGAASLSVARGSDTSLVSLGGGADQEESFLMALQQQMSKVAAFTEGQAASLRTALRTLCAEAPALARADRGRLKSEARRWGDELLELERFVQLNQAGFVKMIKKHDKVNPGAPLWPLYVSHLQHQPWARGGHSDLWTLVSAIFYQLHASAATGATEAAASLPRRVSSSLGSTPAPAPQQQQQGQQQQQQQQAPVVNKYWVSQEDLSAVVYFILQHLPLVPTDSGAPPVSPAAALQQQAGLGSGATTTAAPTPSPRHRRGGGGAAAAAAAAVPGAAGVEGSDFAAWGAPLHTVYLDNCQSLELYHGRLYLRPNARTVKIKWAARTGGQSGDGLGSDSRRASLDDGGSSGWAPRHVVVERKIYREGWKGEPNTKDAMLLPGATLPRYLACTYTLRDALRDMHEAGRQVPESEAAGSEAAAATAAGVSEAAAAAVTVAAGATAGAPEAVAAVGAGAEAAGHGPQQSRPLQQPHQRRSSSIGGGSNASANGQQQQRAGGGPAAAATAAPLASILAGRYLAAPPAAATGDQLSLFSEVQRLVARRGLVPVLHCATRRMVFALPFDFDSVKITVDTDIRMAALDAAAEGDALELAGRAGRALRAAIARGVVEAGDSMTNAAAAATAAASAGDSRVSGEHPSGSEAAAGVAGAAGAAGAAAAGAAGAAAEPANGDGRGGSGGGGGGPSREAAALEGASGGSSWSEEGINASEAERLSRQLWGRLFTEDLAEEENSYALPYAVLKISTSLPPGVAPPGWLQALAESEYVTQVEDFSKASHGCAVLMPDTARAVPFWVDDHLIELSTERFTSQLEEGILLEEAIAAEAKRAASGIGWSPSGIAGGGTAAGGTAAGGPVVGSVVARGRSSSGGVQGASSDGGGGGAAAPETPLVGGIGHTLISWVSGRMSGGGAGSSGGGADVSGGGAVVGPASSGGGDRAGRCAASSGGGRSSRQSRRSGRASKSPRLDGGSGSVESDGATSDDEASMVEGTNGSRRRRSGTPAAEIEPFLAAAAQQAATIDKESHRQRSVRWHDGSAAAVPPARSGGPRRRRRKGAGEDGGDDEGGSGSGSEGAVAGRLAEGYASDDEGEGSHFPQRPTTPRSRLLTSPLAALGFATLPGALRGASATGWGGLSFSGGGGGSGGGGEGPLRALQRRMSESRERARDAAIEESLVRHAGRGHGRPSGRYRPVQLIESQEFLHSESAFLMWLGMAVYMASAAVLLLAVGAIAYVSPLAPRGLYIAEDTALLLLPTSCCLAGYAAWGYLRRAERLSSMRRRRLDDAIGANAMLFIVVASFLGILVLHIADLVFDATAPSEDDPSADGVGGDGPPSGGGGSGGFAAVAARRALRGAAGAAWGAAGAGGGR